MEDQQQTNRTLGLGILTAVGLVAIGFYWFAIRESPESKGEPGTSKYFAYKMHPNCVQGKSYSYLLGAEFDSWRPTATKVGHTSCKNIPETGVTWAQFGSEDEAERAVRSVAAFRAASGNLRGGYRGCFAGTDAVVMAAVPSAAEVPGDDETIRAMCARMDGTYVPRLDGP